jgi:hypothetical protein
MDPAVFENARSNIPMVEEFVRWMNAILLIVLWFIHRNERMCFVVTMENVLLENARSNIQTVEECVRRMNAILVRVLWIIHRNGVKWFVVTTDLVIIVDAHSNILTDEECVSMIDAVHQIALLTTDVNNKDSNIFNSIKKLINNHK